MHPVDFLVMDGSVTPTPPAGSWALTFDESLPPGAFDRQAQGWRLAADWREVGARFTPFAVIQAFVQALMQQRPGRLVLDTLNGVSADLARLGQAMGLPVIVRQPVQHTPSDPHARRWLDALLRHVTVLPAGQDLPPCKPDASANGPLWDYGQYALGMRDHDLLLRMHSPDVEHFGGCRQVLDVGCGTGIMLEALTRADIHACGVDRNSASVRFANSLGLQVHSQDALDYLEQHPSSCDGLYCSHFVEHLPMDAVDRLIRLCAQALQPGGVAVFVFPDPESIRSQLLGFWRDPEHVRFYHPELIASVASVHGLTLEYSSQNIPGRRVGPFSLEPPPMPDVASPASAGLWDRLAQRLGLARQHQLQALQEKLAHQQQLIGQLWQANQTWAWEDNAVLKFRKPGP